MFNQIFLLSFLLFAFLLILISKLYKKDIKRLKNKYNIQTGKITYKDLNHSEKTLFLKKYRICGKPDYIITQKNSHIPVEIKSGYHLKPEKHHIMQLAAYCYLVEEKYNEFIPYGLLVYYDTGIECKIEFNPKIRFELESTIKNMRYSLTKDISKRNHNDFQKCKSCSFSNYCDQRII